MAFYGQDLGRRNMNLARQYELNHACNPLAPVMPGEVFDSPTKRRDGRRSAGTCGGGACLSSLVAHAPGIRGPR